MVMLKLEEKGFDLKLLQRFLTLYAEPVDISEKWIDKQEFCYGYEPRLIGTVYRLKGIPVEPPQIVNRRPVYEFEPLVFSLASEVPYTFNANVWEKVKLDRNVEKLRESLNKNSPDQDDPWLLF